MSGYNFIDIVVFAVVFISALFAFLRGFIGTTLSLLGWVLVAYLTVALFPVVQPFFSHSTESGALETIGGYAFLGIVLAITVAILISLITKVIPFHQGVMDRILGILIGVARGLFIVAVVFTIYVVAVNAVLAKNKKAQMDIDEVVHDNVLNAASYPLLKKMTLQILDFMPADVQQSLDKQIENGTEQGKDYIKEKAENYVKDKTQGGSSEESNNNEDTEEKGGIDILVNPSEGTVKDIVKKVLPELLENKDSSNGGGSPVDLNKFLNQLK